MTRWRRNDPSRAVEAVASGEPIPVGWLEEPADLDALRAAIAVRAAHATDTGTDVPSEAFVTRLHRELVTATSDQAAASVVVSRRTILTGAVAAGSVAAGVVAGVVGERTVHERRVHDMVALVPTTGEWVPVAPVADAEAGVVRFDARGVVGFVSIEGGSVHAVSGVCTHLGCLLQADTATGRLDCPCHRTSFRTDGTVANFQLATAPGRLPSLTVRRAGDAIEAFLPPARPG